MPICGMRELILFTTSNAASRALVSEHARVGAFCVDIVCELELEREVGHLEPGVTASFC